jgi:hypothetical protein
MRLPCFLNKRIHVSCAQAVPHGHGPLGWSVSDNSWVQGRRLHTGLGASIGADLSSGATSCHGALIFGCVSEVHVPVQGIRRLLAQQPDDRALGIHGMEMGVPTRYDEFLITREGSTRVFATHGYYP